MLSAQTIAIVKATVPVLQQYGEQITRHFYNIMFRDYSGGEGIFQSGTPGCPAPSRARSPTACWPTPRISIGSRR